MTDSPRADVAVIGGSGFYSFLPDPTEHVVETPYGEPSAPIGIAEVAGRRVAFLPRHGRHHDHPPHAVTDGCGGIDDESRERVFDVGYRGSAARTPESPLDDVHTSRAGLGLAIVKGIVEAHHGAVAVANVGADEAGVAGCRFVVRLPA